MLAKSAMVTFAQPYVRTHGLVPLKLNLRVCIVYLHKVISKSQLGSILRIQIHIIYVNLRYMKLFLD